MSKVYKNIFSVEGYYEAALETGAEIETIGYSVEERPIQVLKKGKGNIKILVIARLHGNEPAPTQAVLEFLKGYSDDAIEVNCLFLSNPDGAALYEKKWLENNKPHWKNNFEDARLNALKVDINRDWLDLTQKETISLQKYIFALRPNLVLDLHEFYWSDKGYPPKFPTDDEDGFLATMTDSPFYLVENSVVDISKNLMENISEKLVKDFKWETKFRHFIGDKKRDKFENPRFLGIYLALRGIPKLLIETWGVGCSTLMLDKRVKYHKNAIEYTLCFVKENRDKFEENINKISEVTFSLNELLSENKERFLMFLDKHNFQYKIERQKVSIRCFISEIGFLKTIYYQAELN